MKNAKKLFVICLAAFMLFSFAACEPKEDPSQSPDTATPDSGDTTTPTVNEDGSENETTDLILTATKATANIGETVTFTSVLKVGEATSTPESVTYTIVEGTAHATITGNVLTVAQTATNDAEIKVQATAGNVTSNIVSVKVAISLTALSISSDNTTINRGGASMINVAKTPENAADTVTWVLVEGNDSAAMFGNVLVVNQTAADGAVIKVKAVSGSIESNVLTFTVDVPDTSIPLTSLSISSDNTTINRGGASMISVAKTPGNATDVITWQVIEGSDVATMAGDILMVDQNAVGGTVIKIKAVSGSIESNVLEFTVAHSQEEINNSRYFMNFDKDTITFDKNDHFAAQLNVSIYNYNFEEVTDCEVEYSIQSGSEFIDLTPNGYACYLTALGHGTATVRATIRGTTISKTATINVIVPPQVINLPEMLRERPNHNYSFSMQDPKTQAPYAFPFTASPIGDLVCTDMKVTFAHEDGSTGESVAIYSSDNKITFLKEGLVTVTVSSNSGSRVETTTSYKFNVNKGYNVSTFEELIALGNDPTYNGSQPINFVVTQKPVGEGKIYGYDIVPAIALKPQTTAGQTLDELKTNASARFINKGVIINGNRHKIDASQLRVPTADERQANDTWSTPGNLLEIIPYTDAQELQPLATYMVELNDLTIIGNCPIDYDAESSSPFGVYHRGIKIGGEKNDKQPANYYLTMNNVTTEAFRTGMRLMHIVDGRVNNAKVDNCFGNGFEIGASIIELHNTTYGACGAVGIEVSPEHSNKAGTSQNQAQQITFSGETNFTFFNSIDNSKQTIYMSKYNLSGMSVPQILQGAIAYEGNALNINQIDHLINMDQDQDYGKVGYVTFQFHDIGTGTPNVSQIIYPAWQQGGIINARDLPTDGVDTTHQYIELDVTLAVPGMGTVSAGKAYFINLNYVPAN